MLMATLNRFYDRYVPGASKKEEDENPQFTLQQDYLIFLDEDYLILNTWGLGLWFLFLDEKLQKDNTFFTAIQYFKQKDPTLNRDCWRPYKSLTDTWAGPTCQRPTVKSGSWCQNPLGWVWTSSSSAPTARWSRQYVSGSSSARRRRPPDLATQAGSARPSPLPKP
jgi:hypothetical protein